MKEAKPRKPLGMLWSGDVMQVDFMLEDYGLKRLKELHAWLGRAIAWAEIQPPEKHERWRK